MITWLESTTVVSAFIFAASSLSSCGGIARSSAATTNAVGFVRQAADLMFAPKQSALIGPCAAVKSCFSESDRSCAKSSRIPSESLTQSRWDRHEARPRLEEGETDC